MQYNHIKINLELNDFERCRIIAPTHYINIDNPFVNFKPFEYLIQNVDGVISTARFIHFDLLNRRLYISRISDNGFLSLTVTDQTLIDDETKQFNLLYEKDNNNMYINERFFIRGTQSEFEVMPRINATERVHRNRTVNFNGIVLKNCFLLVEYGFLDDEERIRFSRARHEYLIEQLFFTGERVIDGLNQSFKIDFTQPCKELIWTSQLTLAQNLRNNDFFNYTDTLIRDENGDVIGNNIITQATILFNGYERLSLRDIEYFSKLQIYQNHRNGATEGINVYSFALYPEKHQPSGTANLSRIDNVDVRVNVIPEITFDYTAKLNIYGVCYNILRIANGISGLVFSIDF